MMKSISLTDKKPEGFFISGTDTGVGKTLFTAALAYKLQESGIEVGVMKPLQSGFINPLSPDSDLSILLKASGCRERTELVSPYTFKAPLAPLVAAEKEGRRINPKRITRAFQELKKRADFMLVEGIGGLLVPITRNYFVSDLVYELGLPLILVSSTRLGTINQTLLSLQEARNKGIEIAGIIFNAEKPYLGPAEKGNPEIISRLSNIPVLGIIPYLRQKKIEKRIKSCAALLKISSFLPPSFHRIPLPARGKDASCRKKAGGEKSILDRTKELEKADKKYIWHPFTQMQEWEKEEITIIESGEGSRIKDLSGREYLDGMASYWVNTQGHRNRQLNQAINEQLNRIAHSTFLGLSNSTPIKLARSLVKIAPAGLTRVFYSDNGSTAVEAALKMAFQYWQQSSDREDKKKIRFISFKNSYHGDTIGAVSIGGINLFHRLYKPLLFKTIKVPSPYCYRCEFAKVYPDCGLYCVQVLERTVKEEQERIAALIIEPLVQGPGGIIVSPPGFLRGVREICTKYRIILIADEVATGFGRTAKMFACEHEGVRPDILCLSKGISGGYLPLAATLVKEKIYQGFLGSYEEFRTFFHGHTYTANPLACAAALKNIELFLSQGRIKILARRSRFLALELTRLKEIEEVGEIRQCGFFVGIELVKNKSSKTTYPLKEKRGIKTCLKAKEMGLIIRPLGNVIVLAPPLSASREELKKMVKIIREAIISSR